MLANDLCAIYVKDETEEYRQRRRDPVTTVESICSFMNKASGINGLKKARRAIQYVLDRSNSPMESKLAALAVLPLHYGGYGLSKPFLNHFVRLNKEAEEFLGQSQLCCDMVWLAKKVILEYDSNLSHLEIHQHFKDKKRSTALTISGYKVISITAEQLRDFHSVDNMFMQLRHVLNMRTHKDRIDKFAELRWNVVHGLMFKKRCYE